MTFTVSVSTPTRLDGFALENLLRIARAFGGVPEFGSQSEIRFAFGDRDGADLFAAYARSAGKHVTEHHRP